MSLLSNIKDQVIALTDADTWEKITFNLGSELLNTLLTDDNTEFIKFLDENKSKYGLTSTDITLIAAASHNTIIEEAYVPTVYVNSYGLNLMAVSSTENIIIKGSFVDYINTATFIGKTTGGGSVTIISKTFDTLVVQVTADAIVQNYDLVLTDFSGNQFSHVVNAENINVYIPDTAANGATGLELWTIGTIANNAITVDAGTFACEDSGGNGWNEHAYFGGNFNATSQLIVEFTVTKVSGASTGYVFIRMNTTTAANTSGNPRLYLNNGTNLNIYNGVGANTSTTFQEGDVIRIVFTATTMETFINGNSVQTHTGTYNITDMFFNVTGYRVTECSNIKIITD